MDRALWMAVGAALVLLAGCERKMSYDQLDAMRANALNALDRANSAHSLAEDVESSVSDHEDQIADLQSRVEDLEARLGD